MEVEKQLKNRKVYQKVKFRKITFTDLVGKSNTMFKNLKKRCNFRKRKNATNLGKLDSVDFLKKAGNVGNIP